jgi:hypothetical protein
MAGFVIVGVLRTYLWVLLGWLHLLPPLQALLSNFLSFLYWCTMYYIYIYRRCLAACTRWLMIDCASLDNNYAILMMACIVVVLFFVLFK